jgi:hypothetical protein
MSRIRQIVNTNEKTDRECECGENFHNVHCADCNVVYCTRTDDSYRFGKLDANGVSLCRSKSMRCEICKKIYCKTPWIKCQACSYMGRVQCDNCKTNCSICGKIVHIYCSSHCEDCGVKMCNVCIGYSDAVIPIGTPLNWCRKCSEKIPEYNEDPFWHSE